MFLYHNIVFESFLPLLIPRARGIESNTSLTMSSWMLGHFTLVTVVVTIIVIAIISFINVVIDIDIFYNSVSKGYCSKRFRLRRPSALWEKASDEYVLF